MEQHHQQKQKTFDFDQPDPCPEPTQVARDTSLPPPLVRPDRQITFDSQNPFEWPSPDALHDHDTITVDRVQPGMDGPAHRFVIKRDDVVEAWFGNDSFHTGTVVGISHARSEVRVRFTEGTEGQWFSVGAIYPCPEPHAEQSEATQCLSDSIGHVNRQNAPAEGFTDADLVPAAASPLPTEPEPDATPYTFDEFKELLKKRGRHESFEQYQADFERLFGSKESVIAELLTRYKAPQLKNVAGNFGEWGARSNTKQQNAESVYQKMLGYFLLDGGVSYGMHERYEDAVAKKVRAVTAETWHEHFQAVAEKQKEREESLADPQTLSDFATFIRLKGQNALTNEQMARWDCMHADLARERRAANGPSSTVTQFEASEAYETEFTVKEGYHDKRECPLWIVQLGGRVEKETYKELLAKAKQLGGWYSSFKKSDAGFQFLSEDAAQSFTGLLSGNTDRSDILAARQERKEQTTSERLHELAAGMLSRSEETIEQSHQSLQNTARRADIQAGVRGRAYAEAALGRTLHSIADALSRGEAKYLDGVRHRTHIEELDRVLNLAKWARIRAIRKADTESSYGYGLRVDEEDAKPYSEDDIRFAEYPYPSVYARNLRDLVVGCQNRRGLKQLSAKLLKRLPRNPEHSDFVRFDHDYELGLLRDFITRAKAAGVDCERVADELTHYERLQKARIGDVHELRAALREYLPHKASARGDDPVLVAERELIGKDLPGFFPTPEPVIQQMLELAQIEEGHTVLEPSCGKGDIVTEIAREYPNAQITAIELNPTLADVLAAKDIEVTFGDFLQHIATYDRIVMNPPFEKGADIDHLRHAFGLLSSGGRLVSVMSEGPFFRSDAKATEFRDWLDTVTSETHELPEGAFAGADAFRQTSVRTRLVVIDKD